MKILLLLAVAVQLFACSATRRIYLEDYSQYTYDTIQSRVPGESSVFGYRLYQTGTIRQVDSMEVVLPGILLRGVQLYHNDARVNAAFANANDTCRITYHYDREVQRVGQAALLSMVYYFSREENRVRPQPFYQLKRFELSGVLRLAEDSSAFVFQQQKKELHYVNEGWLRMGPDTLTIETAKKALSSSGKITKEEMGLLVTGGKEKKVYAALDLVSRPGMIYLANQLSAKERTLLAALLNLLYANGLKAGEQLQEEKN